MLCLVGISRNFPLLRNHPVDHQTIQNGSPHDNHREKRLHHVVSRRKAARKLNSSMLLVSDEGSTDSVSPAPSNNSMNSQNSTTKEEKKYYCQRCLNHSLQYTRKGHKPFCKYATCSCSQCRMVEERRQLNNMLSRKKVPLPPSETVNGRRIRDPKCARCSAHGLKKPLRGHKKSSCPYYTCTCQLCNLVENRRSLMAKQIKLRRDQQRKRAAEEAGTATGEERLLAEEKENDGIDVEKRVENPSTTVVVPKPMLPIAPQLTLPSILPSISM
ncbi:unnamed protein product, partial [Mesorhabditis spiculigera]